MKTNTLIIMLAAVIASGSAGAAGVCIADDNDASGCQPGDVVLRLRDAIFRPQSQAEFAARNCDFSRSIVWSMNGDVSCIYAGPKTVYEAEDALRNQAEKNAGK